MVSRGFVSNKNEENDSLMIYIETEDVYKDIADDVEKRFDASNYKINIPLPTRMNKKMIELMKMNWDERLRQKLLHLH